jgi:hypothetical protein
MWGAMAHGLHSSDDQHQFFFNKSSQRYFIEPASLPADLQAGTSFSTGAAVNPNCQRVESESSVALNLQ